MLQWFGPARLQYLHGVRATPGGSAAALLDGYLQQSASAKRAANMPVSQRFFYNQNNNNSESEAQSQRHNMIQLRLGAAQMLASTENRIGNLNEAHPLYYAQTVPRAAGLCVPLVLALKHLNISRLTELQGALIPLMLKGKHVIAHSETGTGKSFGIALAVANRIIRDNLNYRLHTVILVPTEELALQYDKWFRHFGGCTSQVVQAAVESIPLETQLARLHNVQPHVLVGTPQRIADINRLSKNIIGEKLRRKVDCVVLDEADLILEADITYGRQRLTGANLVDRLFRSNREEVPAQLVAASATVDGITAQTLNAWTRNDKAVRLTTSFVEHTIPPTICFYMFAATRSHPLPHALETILRLICRQNSRPRVLLFTNAEEVQSVCQVLNNEIKFRAPEAAAYLAGGHPQHPRNFAAALHSLPQDAGEEVEIKRGAKKRIAGHSLAGSHHETASANVRPHQIIKSKGDVYVRNNSTLSAMNDGALLVGVASYEMSRGLHVTGVTHVIMYGECPPSTEFVHCAGRTGRMGASGDVIVLFPPSSGRALQQVCRSVELEFSPGKLEHVEKLLNDGNGFSDSSSLHTLAEENRMLEEDLRLQKIQYLVNDAQH